MVKKAERKTFDIDIRKDILYPHQHFLENCYYLWLTIYEIITTKAMVDKSRVDRLINQNIRKDEENQDHHKIFVLIVIYILQKQL